MRQQRHEGVRLYRVSLRVWQQLLYEHQVDGGGGGGAVKQTRRRGHDAPPPPNAKRNAASVKLANRDAVEAIDHEASPTSQGQRRQLNLLVFREGKEEVSEVSYQQRVL